MLTLKKPPPANLFIAHNCFLKCVRFWPGIWTYICTRNWATLRQALSMSLILMPLLIAQMMNFGQDLNNFSINLQCLHATLRSLHNLCVEIVKMGICAAVAAAYHSYLVSRACLEVI